MAQSVTLASTGTSGIIDLNPILKETIMQVTVTSGSSGTSFVQFSLDDPNASTTMTWANLSSAIASSAADGIGQALAVLSPVSALRLATQSSTTTGVVGTT